MANPISSFLRRLLPGSSPSDRIRKALTPSGPDLEFEEAIRKQMRFLFEQFGASIISNQYFPSAFGNAIVVIETNRLRLRVVRDRDEVRLDFAPPSRPDEWMDIAFALAAIGDESGDSQFSLYRAMTSIARHLDPKFEALQDAFAEDRCPATLNKIATIRERERARAIERLNAMRRG